MATGAIIPIYRWQVLDNGVASAGAIAYFFLSGTNTPAPVYADSGLNTSRGVSVTADAEGVLPIIYFAAHAYRVLVTTSAGATIFPAQDGIYDFAQVQLAATTGAGLVGYQSTATGSVVTTVNAKLQTGWLDLKDDFGAVGDNATDDAAAVQAWLSAGASTGKILYAPPGWYKMDSAVSVTLTDDIGLHVLGCGSGGLTPRSSRFILGANLASNDTPLWTINGASQSTTVEIDGIEFRGESRTGTGLKIASLSATPIIRRSWFQNFLGRGLWLYACIGQHIESVHSEGNATGLEIGGTSSIGEGAVISSKFASNTTRQVMLNTGATFVPFIGCTIYGVTLPSYTIGVEFADDVFCIGFYQCNFENSTPALYAATGVADLIVEGCVIDARNHTGAGTKYGIDLAETANARIMNNVISISATAGGTIVGVRLIDSTFDTVGPNRILPQSGGGTETKYVLPTDVAPVYGIKTNGDTLALVQTLAYTGLTYLNGNETSIANAGTQSFGPIYGGLVVVRAGEFSALFMVSAAGTTVTEVSDPSTSFSTSAGTASSANCYFSGGNFTVQNLLGSTLSFKVHLVGTLS